MSPLPQPRHSVVDQTPLNGTGASAFRHSLAVPLPTGLQVDLASVPLGEPGDRLTWPEIETAPGGGFRLAVIMHTGSDTLTDEQRGMMTGELAESWVRVTG